MESASEKKNGIRFLFFILLVPLKAKGVQATYFMRLLINTLLRIKERFFGALPIQDTAIMAPKNSLLRPI